MQIQFLKKNNYSILHLSHFSILGLLIITSSFFISDVLFAQSPVRILSIDNNSHPLTSLQVNVQKLHSSLVKHKGKPTFQVYEISNGVEKEISKLQVQSIKQEAEYLNIVWILDASLSVASHRFAESLAFSKAIVRKLTEKDRMAIYSAAKAPKLVTDFSHDPMRLMDALSSIRRKGKMTRLYDSIYSGIYTARNIINSDSQKVGKSRTVLVLLTDGKEESSYLSADDCFELSLIGKRYNIPVYVLLFNGAADQSKVSSVKTKTKQANNYHFLKRLTLKTEGAFIVDPLQMQSSSLYQGKHHKRVEATTAFLNRLRQLPHSVYQIRYSSPSNFNSFHGLLGAKLLVRVSLKEGGYTDTISARLPLSLSLLWNSLLQYPVFSLISILGLLSPLLLILAIAIFVKARRETMRRKHSGKNLEERFGHTTSPEETLRAESEPPYTSDDENLASVVPPPPQYPKQEELQKRRDYPRREHLREDYPVRKGYRAMSFSDWDGPEILPYQSVEPGVLMEDERTLYLREHSYRMLQLALRSAGTYKSASLSIITGEPPKKRIYDLFLDNTLLGNGRWAHVPVYDPAASPLHARIKKVGQCFVIYDLMSGSGLYVNKAKVLRPLGLKHGDEIRIGRKRFTFLGQNGK